MAPTEQTVQSPSEPSDMLKRIQKQTAETAEEQPVKAVKPSFQAIDTSKPDILKFVTGSDDIVDAHIKRLKEVILPTLQSKNMGLNIISYALPTDNGFSSDRRLSLSRALAVRSILVEEGFNPALINLRVLGSETTQQPVDRIELEFVPR